MARDEKEEMEMQMRDIGKYNIATFWMKIQNEKCFDDAFPVIAVEVPVREYKRPKVKEAKEKELKNMDDYEVFKEVDDVTQERIVSKWVIMRKEKADEQKQLYK